MNGAFCESLATRFVAGDRDEGRAARKSPASPPPVAASVREPAIDGDHGRAAGADGVDDLGVVDALQIDPAPRGAMRKEMTDGNISSVLAGMPAPG